MKLEIWIEVGPRRGFWGKLWDFIWELVRGMALAAAGIVLFWILCIVALGLLLAWSNAHP